jgi:FkbM family methyltransferase
MFNNLIGTLQQSVAKSALGTRIAIKLRNQCNSVIGLRCKSSIKAEHNGEAWLADRIAPTAGLVIDVGANVGDWIDMFASRMTLPGHAILFEPNPEAAAKLRNRVLPNHDLKVEIQERAVSDMVGTAEFFMEPDAGETSSLVKVHIRSLARVVAVPITTLDDVMAARGMGCFIDMLKIDAEGYDLRVLMGARRLLEARRIGAIQFEYNSPWVDAGSTLSYAFALLREAKYSVFLLKSDGLYCFEPGFSGEYFRYSNFVALRDDILEKISKSSRIRRWI